MDDQKTPEQLEQEQKAAEQQAAERLAAKIERAGEEHFVYKDRVFVPIMHAIEIPKLGVRTALEICLDEEAQKFLVEVPGNIGEVIKEVE